MARLYDKYRGEPIRPLSGLYGPTAFMLRAYILFEIALGISSALVIWFYYQIENDAFDIGANIMQMAEVIDMVTAVSAIGYLVSLVVCFVLVGRFTFRAMKNLHIANAADADMSPTGTILWHFVPIAFLFKPYSGVAQIWRGSDNLSGETDDVPGIMSLWWAGWIISLILSNISFRMSGGFGEASDEEMLRMSYWLDVGSSIAGALAAFFLIRILKQIRDNQTRVFADFSPQETNPQD